MKINISGKSKTEVSRKNAPGIESIVRAYSVLYKGTYIIGTIASHTPFSELSLPETILTLIQSENFS